MKITAKLQALREKMRAKQVDAFVVYSADPHMSEYLPEEWKEREWLSGFTGSAGLVVITQDKAGLWTDSRYFVQADEELKGSGIALFKQGVEGVPTYSEWLLNELPPHSTVAINGLCAAHDDWENLEKTLTTKNIKIKDLPLLAALWDARVVGKKAPVFIHKLEYCGQSVTEKLTAIRKEMEQKNATLHIVSSLDDIAWTLNLRGSDVEYNPVFLSYLIIGKEQATLFIDTEKCTPEVNAHLAQANVRVQPYECFFEELARANKETILIAAHSNQTIFEQLPPNNKLVVANPPSQFLKAIKNETEIAGMRNAMRKDGVALVQFLYWLEKNVGKIPLNEFEVGEKLLGFRAKQENFVGASFGTIAGYNANGAIVHYSAKENTAQPLEKKGVLLLDSGGQYLDGTTDITRTIPLGEVSETFKKDYTLVLKGMIALSLAKFPKGTRGCNLDAIARQPLWQNCRNYGHGTGHGVGCFLNVHETPQSIRQELKEQALFLGMITSNEPGLYRKGKYGIRHENLILCIADSTSDFGVFYTHETLTLCPFFTNILIKELLSEDEINWLNEYQKEVYETLSPYLDTVHKRWLEEVCRGV